jgi:hypothetical protein
MKSSSKPRVILSNAGMNRFFKCLVVVSFIQVTWNYAQGEVFSVLSPVNPSEGFVDPFAIGSIPGVPNMRIHILELAVGGDADAGSGPVLFSALGSGVAFSWSAGQTPVGATYTLAPTPVTEPPRGARGFSYASVSEWADPGSSVLIRWHGNVDPDGFHTESFDSQGTFFNDPVDTARAWLRYEMVAVPEPPTGTLLMVGGVGILAGVWRPKVLVSRRRRGN